MNCIIYRRCIFKNSSRVWYPSQTPFGSDSDIVLYSIFQPEDTAESVASVLDDELRFESLSLFKDEEILIVNIKEIYFTWNRSRCQTWSVKDKFNRWNWQIRKWKTDFLDERKFSVEKIYQSLRTALPREDAGCYSKNKFVID
jgi:hypothetical protein